MATPRKILLIYDCLYPASLGGVEYRNYCLAKALAARGHQVTLAGWGHTTATELHPNMHIVHLPFSRKLHDQDGKRGLWPTLLFALAVLRLNPKKYDVIETANIPYLHILPLALHCALAHKPLIVTWHEFFGNYWRDYKGPLAAGLFGAMERLVLKLAPIRWAVSQHTQRRLQDQGAASTLLANGVWLKDIRAVQQRPTIVAPDLLYAGRLIPEKRIDLLITALTNPELAQVTLGIVGDGPSRAALQDLVAKYGLQARVQFYGRLPQIEAMWHLLAHCKIAVQPSQREGFGLFPLEAMALGKPVIYCAAPDNAIGEIARDGKEGVSAAPDPIALAHAIARLLNNPEIYQAMSDQAVLRATEFDWPTIAIRAESLIDAILASF